MTTIRATRPDATEFAPYYGRYVDKPGDGDIVATLESDRLAFADLLRGIPEEKAGHRYAEGKWSIRELLGHVIDAERVFAYRALRFGRGDTTELPGFEQDVFVRGANFEERTLTDLTSELEHVRAATIDLFRSFSDEALQRKGVASGNPVTVRALAWITAGHARHHFDILRERYL